MPTRITSQNSVETELNEMDQEQGANILKELSVQLVGNDGSTKTGTLNIVRRRFGGNNEWEVRRQSAWSRFWNLGFQESLGPEKTAEILRKIALKATGQTEEEVSKKIEAGKQDNFKTSDERKLYPLLRYLSQTREVDPVILRPALHIVRLDKPELLVEKIEGPQKRSEIKPIRVVYGSEAKILERLGIKADSFEDYARLNKINQGGSGNIVPLEDGRLLKIEQRPQLIRRNGPHPIRQAELSAAYLFSQKREESTAGVLAPTHFIFREPETERYHLVPVQEAKAFLQKRSSTDLEYFGQVMPTAPGRDLLTCLVKQGMSIDEKKEIARQMHEILFNLSSRGFVHHDMKPDNFIWDPESRKLNLIDHGLLEKLSKNPEKGSDSTVVDGTFETKSPLVSGGSPHSTPVDGFSAGMTLLMTSIQIKDKPTFLETLLFGKIPKNRYYDKSLMEGVATGEKSYLVNWLDKIGSNPNLSESEKQELRVFREALGNPNTLENYCHQLIQASFLPKEQYEQRLEALRNHPYLTSK